MPSSRLLNGPKIVCKQVIINSGPSSSEVKVPEAVQKKPEKQKKETSSKQPKKEDAVKQQKKEDAARQQKKEHAAKQEKKENPANQQKREDVAKQHIIEDIAKQQKREEAASQKRREDAAKQQKKDEGKQHKQDAARQQKRVKAARKQEREEAARQRKEKRSTYPIRRSDNMARGRNTQFFKELFINGAWINWLAPVAMLLYATVTLGCMNAKAGIVNLYLAAISPSQGTVVRVGYFGVCIQTPENKDWICSRFIKGDKGVNAKHIALIKAVKRLQWNALYPLPALAACLLCILYAAFLVFRNRSEKRKRYTVFGLWLSCAIGFAGALIPMMLGQALHYAAPMYGSLVAMEVSMMNIAITWAAFGLHLVYILTALWWHRRIGGAGRYGGYIVDEEGGEDPRMAQMQYDAMQAQMQQQG